jgi:hypothetical protein
MSHVGSLNRFRRFRARVMFCGSNEIRVTVQAISPELQQVLRDIRDLLARIEEQQ